MYGSTSVCQVKKKYAARQAAVQQQCGVVPLWLLVCCNFVSSFGLRFFLVFLKGRAGHRRARQGRERERGPIFVNRLKHGLLNAFSRYAFSLPLSLSLVVDGETYHMMRIHAGQKKTSCNKQQLGATSRWPECVGQWRVRACE